MRKAILAELVVVTLSLFDSSRVKAQALEPPLPEGSTYYKGRIVSQIGVGIIGCTPDQFIKGDGSGCASAGGGAFTGNVTDGYFALAHPTNVLGNGLIDVGVTTPSHLTINNLDSLISTDINAGGDLTLNSIGTSTYGGNNATTLQCTGSNCQTTVNGNTTLVTSNHSGVTIDTLAGDWFPDEPDSSISIFAGTQLSLTSKTEIMESVTPSTYIDLVPNSHMSITDSSPTGILIEEKATDDIAGSIVIDAANEHGSSISLEADSPSEITANNSPICTQATGCLAGGSGGVSLTSATTISSSTFVTTGLVMPTIPVNTVARGACHIIWEQIAGAAPVSFGAGMSNAPTNLWVLSKINYATAGNMNVAYNAQTATTATIVGMAATPESTETGYFADFNFVLSAGATNPVALTWYGLTSTTADALVVEPGSYCEWFP